ncbi:hypothetical protein Pint_36608 [Pistacia integerrima]|uniref:Uncharacterized protein n=2 Tax=Pistacia integerrima TaxID=434235 RepID=A0ACC0Y4Q6_9ROSI|nr:hypothetical protein Pint_36602 [Pistacia integerrima]KAJ0028462.1 hypothetical protein Pint_36608 [Pistacia integerrima]
MDHVCYFRIEHKRRLRFKLRFSSSKRISPVRTSLKRRRFTKFVICQVVLEFKFLSAIAIRFFWSN